MTIRLRQVALVAHDLEQAVAALSERLGIEVGFRDPGVGEFGLVNAVFPVGTDFLEVVSPEREGTTAGRLLEKRGGDGGYMVIVQCDDLERRRARLHDLGVRVVWSADLDDIAGTHLHPRDVGGAIVSIDQALPWESWRWAGPTWRDHIRTEVVDGIAGVTIGAADPTAMAARWAEVLDAPVKGTAVYLDEGVITFTAAGPRGEGVDSLAIHAADRARAGEAFDLVGVAVTLV
ncbi:MAG TPA: VOC family protein [Acidimicrobiales bacterium]